MVPKNNNVDGLIKDFRHDWIGEWDSPDKISRMTERGKPSTGDFFILFLFSFGERVRVSSPRKIPSSLQREEKGNLQEKK